MFNMYPDGEVPGWTLGMGRQRGGEEAERVGMRSITVLKASDNRNVLLHSPDG